MPFYVPSRFRRPANLIRSVLLSMVTLSTAAGCLSAVSYTPPILPIEISVDENGNVDLAFVAEWVTPLGRFALTSSLDEPAPETPTVDQIPPPGAGQWNLIAHVATDPSVVTVFVIDTAGPPTGSDPRVQVDPGAQAVLVELSGPSDRVVVEVPAPQEATVVPTDPTLPPDSTVPTDTCPTATSPEAPTAKDLAVQPADGQGSESCPADGACTPATQVEEAQPTGDEAGDPPRSTIACDHDTGLPSEPGEACTPDDPDQAATSPLAPGGCGTAGTDPTTEPTTTTTNTLPAVTEPLPTTSTPTTNGAPETPPSTATTAPPSVETSPEPGESTAEPGGQTES